jgi:hypothetical protein
MRKGLVFGKWYAFLNRTGTRSLRVSGIPHRKMNEHYFILWQKTFFLRSHVFLPRKNAYKGE